MTLSYDALGRWDYENYTGGTNQIYSDMQGHQIQWTDGTTYFQNVWGLDGPNEIILRDRYVSGDGTNNYGIGGSGLNERIYAQFDANGDVTSLYQTGGGGISGIVERVLYNAYGQSQWISPSWVSTGDSYIFWHQLFQGEYQLANINADMMGARDFDYTIGAWDQKDPAGFVDGVNVYQAFDSAPVNEVDPFGLAGWKIYAPSLQLSYVPGTAVPASPYATSTAASNATYNSATQWQKLRAQAWTIWETNLIGFGIAYGFANGMPNAAKFMLHFILGSGAPYIINPSDLVASSKVAGTDWGEALIKGVQYVDANPGVKSIVTPIDYQTTTLGNSDWFNALGTYRFWTAGDNIACTNGMMSMSFTFFVRDNYEWMLGSTKSAGPLVDGDMALMHRYGAAREFPVFGNYTVTVTWKAGDLSTVQTANPVDNADGRK